jgi:isopentenyl-diphosphate Delta-isomerase
MERAIDRRLQEELGIIRCELNFLFKFQYHAQFGAVGAENELCSVYIGRHAGRVRPNPEEIAACRWVNPQALQKELTGRGARHFTPWFVLEWARIWQEHRGALSALLASPGAL